MAFDKDFTTVNDRVPLEFNQLFESLKGEIKTPSEKIKMVGICKDLNSNLGSLKKEHIYFLMKEEIIKNSLEFKFSKTRQFDVTSLLIQRLEKSLKEKAPYLNKFSTWLARSIIAELKFREKAGIITDKSFSSKSFSGAQFIEAKRFEKYLTYLNPWMDRLDAMTAYDFNQLTKQVSWIILRRLNERSLLFKRYAISATGDTQVTIFNIPQKLLDLGPAEIKKMNDDTPLSYKELSEVEKSNAKDTVDKATPDDLSTVSDDLAKELEKKTSP